MRQDMFLNGIYGKRFESLRHAEINGEKDYTIRELAKKLSIAASTICAIETENRRPTLEQARTYIQHFGVTLDYLTGKAFVKSFSKTEINGIVHEYFGLTYKSIEYILRLKNQGKISYLNELLEWSSGRE